MMAPFVEHLQAAIGYQFRDSQLLLEALTHSSFAQETANHVRDNEQLEFLGDAVLNFLVSAALVETFPAYEEGKLSRARASLVSAAHLRAVAVQLDLGKHLRLGRGEEKTGGRAKAALLADALEALVAAIYRDGGVDAVRTFVERFVLPVDLAAQAEDLSSIDYKSALQEHLQAAHLPSAEYRVVEEKGPEHQKVYTVEVVAGGRLRAHGKGRSKKMAEQQSAQCVLEQLEVDGEANGRST
jgi:ribonuclease-3